MSLHIHKGETTTAFAQAFSVSSLLHVILLILQDAKNDLVSLNTEFVPNALVLDLQTHMTLGFLIMRTSVPGDALLPN